MSAKPLIALHPVIPSHGRGRRFNPYSAHHFGSFFQDRRPRFRAARRFAGQANQGYVAKPMTKARTNQLGMTEDDNFIVKAAMQLGFEFVDGDTSTMQVSTRNLIAFVSDRSRRAVMLEALASLEWLSWIWSVVVI